tara:strand:+ start:467 stop:817 length:351 start_codon:yes stop_codon:yes gene_type:complete
MFTTTKKSTTNKGNARVWIEGKDLIAFGVSKGDRFDKYILNNMVVLKFNSEGRNKVSGTDTRPVIDLNGKFLNPYLLGSDFYRVGFIKASETSLFIGSSLDVKGNNQDLITIEKVA